MKNSYLFVVAALAASGLLAVPALAGDVVFTLENESSAAVVQLFVSAPESDSWEEDILGEEVLPSGESATVTLRGADDACEWDVRIVYEDGSYTDERDIDLCELEDGTYTITD